MSIEQEAIVADFREEVEAIAPRSGTISLHWPSIRKELIERKTFASSKEMINTMNTWSRKHNLHLKPKAYFIVNFDE